MNNKEFPWDSGEGMWLSSNKTFQERLLDKTLGQIRHRLIESKGFYRKDIKIKWPQKRQVLLTEEQGVQDAEDRFETIAFVFRLPGISRETRAPGVSAA